MSAATQSKLAALNERKKLAQMQRQKLDQQEQAAKAAAQREPRRGRELSPRASPSDDRDGPSMLHTLNQLETKISALQSGVQRGRTALELPTAEAQDELFTRMDGNGNHVLSLAEVDLAVASLFPDCDHKPALMRAYKAADRSGNGYIDRGEFAQLLQYLVYFNNLWDDFEAMDVTHDRRITLESFVGGCKAVGLNLSPAEAQREFKQMDLDGSGVVLFEEFCTFCAQKHHGAIDAVGASTPPRSRPRGAPAARTPRENPAPTEAAPGSTSPEQELQRFQTELSLLEDDNRRLTSKLEGTAMQSQKDQLQQLREVLSQKQDEMSMLEQRQLEIKGLFRQVHDAKELLKTLSADEAVLRKEIRELEVEVLEHDSASAAQVARAEEIAQALATAGNHAELNRLENDLNKCIEMAEASSRELATVKSKVTSKLRAADAKAAALGRKSQETEAIEADAAARAKELPVVVAAMEATAHALQDAEEELDSKTSAVEAVEAEIRQRIQANHEAIKFARNMLAVTEKKLAMQKRNRSRMNVKVRPDENLAAAMASAKSDVLRGPSTPSRTPSQAARAQTPNSRSAARASRPISAGRTRTVAAPAGGITAGPPADTPKRAWRASSGTGAAADARERQMASLTPVRTRTTTPSRQQPPQKQLSSTPGAQSASGREESSGSGMQGRVKETERRRAKETALTEKEQAMQKREAALEKALQAVERERGQITAEKTALERERKALARKQKDVETLRQQVEAEKEETLRTKEELVSLRAAAESMVRHSITPTSSVLFSVATWLIASALLTMYACVLARTAVVFTRRLVSSSRTMRLCVSSRSASRSSKKRRRCKSRSSQSSVSS